MIQRIIACGMTIFMAGVVTFGYPGVMGAYWQNRFHVGVGETGMIVTFMLLALAVAMFFSGRIHMKVGMRACVLIGLAFYLAAFFILALAKNIYWVYCWGFVANLGCSFWYGPGLTTGQQLMPEKKGLISGILNLAFGIAAAIMSPVLNRLLEGRGYLITNLVLVAMITAAGLSSCFLLKEDPESVTSKAGPAKGGVSLDTSLSLGQALKTKGFWLMWLIWAFMGAAGISMVSLSKSYALSIGMASVALLTVFNLANGISRIVVGMCMDKIGGKITGISAFVMACAGYLLMPHVKGYGLLSLCAIGVGIGFGTLFTISGPMAVNLFGLKNFGMIYGLIFTGYGLVGGIAGPAISGMILQYTGGAYLVVFSYLGVMALLGAILMLFIKEA